MIIGSCSLSPPECSTLRGNQDCLMILLSSVLQTKAVSYQHNESWTNSQSEGVCVVLDCRVRVIFYGGLRWTPWTPWGSWLWPVRPVASPPPLPPTPHPPPSQQTITTPPTPCPAAGAALTATGASEASAVAGVNVEKQREDALSSEQCSAKLPSLLAQTLGSWLSKLRWCCWAQCECVSVKLSFWLFGVNEGGRKLTRFNAPSSWSLANVQKETCICSEIRRPEKRSEKEVKYDCAFFKMKGIQYLHVLILCSLCVIN